MTAKRSPFSSDEFRSQAFEVARLVTETDSEGVLLWNERDGLVALNAAARRLLRTGPVVPVDSILDAQEQRALRQVVPETREAAPVEVVLNQRGNRRIRLTGIASRVGPPDRGFLCLRSGRPTELRESAEDLKSRLAVEEVLAKISQRFVNAPTEELGPATEEALETLGRVAAIDRCYVLRLSRSGNTIRQVYEWCAEGIEPRREALTGLGLEALPWSIRKLRAGQNVRVDSLDELPAEAWIEKGIWQGAGVRSTLTVPMFLLGDLAGVIGMDAVRTPTHWNDDDVRLLEMIAAVIVAAWARARAETALRESEARYRSVIAAMTDGILVINGQGHVEAANASARHILRLSEAELAGRTPPLSARTFIQANGQPFPADRTPWRIAAATGISQNDVLVGWIEDGQDERWLSVNAQPLTENRHRVPYSVVISFHEVTEKKRSEERLQHRLGMEELVSRISTRLLSVEPEDFDGEVDRSLQAIGEFMGVDRVVLDRYDVDRLTLESSHEWNANPLANRTAEVMGLALTEYPWLYRLLASGRTAHVADIETLPEEAAVEKEVWRMLGVRSVLAVPLRIGDALVGSLRFLSRDCDRQWLEEDVRLVRVLAEIFANLFERRRSEEELRRLNAYNRSLIEAILDPLFMITPDGIIHDVNIATEIFTGLGRNQLLGAEFRSVFEEPESASAALDLVFQEGAVHDFELNLKHWDGHVTPVLFNATVYRDRDGRLVGAFAAARDMTRQRKAESALQEAYANLKVWVKELEERNRQTSLLSEMGNLLDSCMRVEEIYGVVGHHAELLFEGRPGVLYLVTDDREILERQLTWGAEHPFPLLIDQGSCWSLRRGRSHVVTASGRRLICDHVTDVGEEFVPHICQPLTAHGETLGIVHQRFSDESRIEAQQQIVSFMAERIAMALSNMRLRETLQRQSTRDPLTGLYNRRFMEETLNRELRRAQRHQTTVALILMDLDHFKEYNDRFGHDAGDELLREVGRLLLTGTRAEDVACRYGGEEFLVIMPGADLESAVRRAEELRQRFVSNRSPRLPTSQSSTLSAGVALYPLHGETPSELVRAADQALYQAKKSGRDRIATPRDFPTSAAS